MADVFAVQHAVAVEVSVALGVAGRPAATRRRDVNAYNAYLKGRWFWNKRTGAAARRGVEYFEKASWA